MNPIVEIEKHICDDFLIKNGFQLIILLKRTGKDLDLEYFRNELQNVQLQSNDAMQLISILKNNPPKHRFRRF